MKRTDGKADVSSELAKIEELAEHLAKELFSIQAQIPDSDEKQNMKTLYWIADTLRTTAIQVHAELYPEPPLKMAA